MSASPLTIIAVATAKPGREGELLKLQEKLVEATLKEDGCLRYELNRSLDDPRIAIFVETWETEEKWRAHMEGAALGAFRAAGGDLVEEIAIHRMAKVAG